MLGTRRHNVLSSRVGRVVQNGEQGHRCGLGAEDPAAQRDGAGAGGFETGDLVGMGYVSAVVRDGNFHLLGEMSSQTLNLFGVTKSIEHDGGSGTGESAGYA